MVMCLDIYLHDLTEYSLLLLILNFPEYTSTLTLQTIWEYCKSGAWYSV